MAVRPLLILFVVSLCAIQFSRTAAAEESPQRKIVLIAGEKSHGPGVHEYEKSVRLLKVMLDRSNLRGVRTEFHLNGWPENPATLDDADTIVTISDGQDGDLYSPVPWMTDERMAVMDKQMRRGCGIVTIHFSTFAPDKYGPQVLEWIGGYFDWQDDTGRKNWYSAIKTLETDVVPGKRDHAILRGVGPFKLREEFYYKLRFKDDDPRLTPIIYVPELSNSPAEQIVAWTVERAEGGRGFGTSMGHFYDNWQHESFRKLLLNAIAWTAKAEVPEQGVEARFYSDEEVAAALAVKPINAVIVTGHQYPGHKWRDTSPVLAKILQLDPRLVVTTIEDVEFLADERLKQYDVVLLNYCNWQRQGLSDAAKANFVKYLNDGGGLTLVHFSNGAFHHSLPEAGESDWPEYRNICRRVWNHAPRAGEKQSGHDAYGKFTVDVADAEHEITRGMKAFETTDELYFRQDGTQPIHVLATARSKVTNEDEPMAFVHQYGKGRVFQTVLGHDVNSLTGAGPAALICRGTAWAAQRERLEQIAKPTASATKVEANPPTKPAAALPRIVAGKFGGALNAKAGHAQAPHQADYDKPPLTVECWAKLDSKQGFNILVAKNPKSSGLHWELFSFAGSGHFTAYLPGYQPDHVRSGVDIADGQWHFVAMTHEGTVVKLVVDGQVAVETAVKAVKAEGETSPLWFGAYQPQPIGCDGLIDDVRISRGVRALHRVPGEAQRADDSTVGLWRFDQADEKGTLRDESKQKNAAALVADAQRGPASAGADKVTGHWGQDAIGFRWTENDSVDGRWNESEIGPFLASVIPLPGWNVAKGLSIRLGASDAATVAYDTGTMSQVAGWQGGFLKFDPARFGVSRSPLIAGELHYSLPNSPAWGDAKVHYRGLYLHNARTVLAYNVDGVAILEAPWVETAGNLTAFSRTFEIAPHAQSWKLLVSPTQDNATITTHDDGRMVMAENNGKLLAIGIAGAGVRLEPNETQGVVAHIPGNVGRVRFKLLVWSGSNEHLSQVKKLFSAAGEPEPLSALTEPGDAQWTKPIVTKGTVGKESGPYQIDTITIPFDNPYKALFFTGGHDFFKNGDIAVCTMHGDVWRVSGIDAQLEKLSWKRMATGLHQALGLKIVDERVYVLGRDQITRLVDRNGDGEADFYECFNNGGRTSDGAHNYAGCLDTDPEGNFYYIRAWEGLVEVSADGSESKSIANGWRNPIGMSVGPGGELTVAPQEGNWTPASAVFEAKRGGWYGFEGPKVTPERPLGYDPPLCWIPRLVDNSSGGQVWVTSDRWGLPRGQLLHMSYGRCWLLAALRENVDGLPQGGVVKMGLDFRSGIMRGRFSPLDGQLYVSGLRGWTTSAADDGCLQRVRYTGAPVHLPTELHVHANGIEILFGEPLDRALAEDPDSYSVQQWNYRYSANYGSADYKASDPKQEGHDDVEVKSATLRDDGRGVFLELAGMKPVMQMEIRYDLRAADGTQLENTIHNTINAVPTTVIQPRVSDQLRATTRLSKEVIASLRPGLILRTKSGNATDQLDDARVIRLAALSTTARESPTAFTPAGSFRAVLDGYVKVEQRGYYRFEIEGSAPALIIVFGLSSAGGELGGTSDGAVLLQKGYNRIKIDCREVDRESSLLQLYWSSERLPRELVPATALFHRGDDPLLLSSELRRAGRDLYATHRCAACHRLPEGLSLDSVRPQFVEPAPVLAGVGSRLRHDWIKAWLRDPHALRADASMPALGEADDAARTRQIADIAAYLSEQREGKSSSAELTTTRPPDRDPAALIERGEVLFEDLGCISCHNFHSKALADAEPDPFQRMSLDLVKAKFQDGALEEFLAKPLAHHATSRMPDFQLTADEAAALAAYLLDRAEGTVEPFAASIPGDPAAGRQAILKLGCLNCHPPGKSAPKVTPAESPLFGAPKLAGCLLGKNVPARAPRFAFDKAQTNALLKFLGTDGASLTRHAPAEEVRRLMTRLNCAACHARDGRASRLPEFLFDEGTQGLPPESIPDLTWTGEKLLGSWTKRLFEGATPYRARPWLRARMPAFPAYAEELSVGLACEHGLQWSSDPVREGATATIVPSLPEAGHKLTLKEGGFDCRLCHALGSEVIDLQNKAQGVSFGYAADRLRYDYYLRWMRDPLRIDPMTKMPRFSVDGRHTAIKAVFDGDADKQFIAIWNYLHTLRPMPGARR